MDVPMSWLKEYAPVTADLKDFMEDMTMSGSKVEGAVTMSGEIKNVVTGRINKIEKHPHADKLVVCKIEVGGGKELTIVTGAPNVKEGDYVPVALDHSVLADGTEIYTSDFRGVISEGMMCSIEELGFDRHDFPEAPEYGIYLFPEPVELGLDVTEAMDLKDDIVEFEITSNRPDCYSIVGIAREAAATYNIPFKYPELSVKEEGEGRAEDVVKVDIENPVLCPRYVARVVKNVKIGPSPRCGCANVCVRLVCVPSTISLTLQTMSCWRWGTPCMRSALKQSRTAILSSGMQRKAKQLPRWTGTYASLTLPCW